MDEQTGGHTRSNVPPTGGTDARGYPLPPRAALSARSDDSPTIPLTSSSAARSRTPHIPTWRGLPAAAPRIPATWRLRTVLGVGGAVLVLLLLAATVLTTGAFGLGSAFLRHGPPAGGTGRASSTGVQATSAAHATTAPATTPSTTGTAPAGLPAGIPSHFSFGVMNAPDDVALLNDMRTHNGTAWEYRYQYLAGGVNTGTGWETWNQPAGAFASMYADESARNQYVPAFVYYELLQSSGSCATCDEATRDVSNIANPAVMHAYYANWRLLMQKVGAFGRPALIIVEPDLWGFLQHSASGTDPQASALPASVSNSGDSDAAQFPNTVQGFAWTLLHVRDRYAPNALLALHVSNWAAREDIGTSTTPGLDAGQLAQSIAHFLASAGLQDNPAGVSTWDILSNDVADRDSGQGANWWDRTNTSYPNFARYIAFATALHAATHRWILLWQVPEGNQYFATTNGSTHHTQDNRAEYILGHIPDFAGAGIAGVLFGPGNGGTSIDDAAHDGITNPPAVTGYQCDRCNTHISVYPDDDGGYLRLYVGAYYRHAVLPLGNPTGWTAPPPPDMTSATATPPPPGSCQSNPYATIGTVSESINPVNAGQTTNVSVVLSLSCTTSALVDIEVYGPTARIAQVTRNYIAFMQNTPQTVTLAVTVPLGTPAGAYRIKVGVFQAGWGALYGWNDNTGYVGVR